MFGSKVHLIPKCSDHGSCLVTLCVCLWVSTVVCVKAACRTERVWYSIVMLLDSISSPISLPAVYRTLKLCNLLHFLCGWHYCNITFLIVTSNWSAINVLRMLTQSSISSLLGNVVAEHCMLHESPIKKAEAGYITLQACVFSQVVAEIVVISSGLIWYAVSFSCLR